MGSEADVSYMVAPELRGRGLASRALIALIAWGTRELGLLCFNLACNVDNTASQPVARKCGFGFVCRQGEELRFRRDASLSRITRSLSRLASPQALDSQMCAKASDQPYALVLAKSHLLR
jgi:RimJ/RimL family protein N-acetyltransferase